MRREAPGLARVTLRTRNPCCQRPVRLPVLVDVPRETYSRTCGQCGARWDISRRFVRDQNGVRVDITEWENMGRGNGEL